MLSEEQQKLLTSHHLLVMPETIEFEVYEMFVELIHEHPGRIDLYCKGTGGDAGAGLAIVDLMALHGKFRGILVGQADSSSATIWAGCQERFVSPNGCIAIHTCSWGSPPNARMDAQVFQNLHTEFKDVDLKTAKTLANASTMPEEWWYANLTRTGSGSLTLIQSDDLIKMKMAKPISQLQRKGGKNEKLK